MKLATAHISRAFDLRRADYKSGRKLEGSHAMSPRLNGRVIAIPAAHTAAAMQMVEMLRTDECRLALGASPMAFQVLNAQIDGGENIYCQRVDLDRSESVKSFFQIAFAQIGGADVIVLEALPVSSRRLSAERVIEVATRRLLHCLDAALPYVGKDLHFIFIAPAYGPAAIPIATAFLGASAAAKRASSIPKVRMSVVSPPAIYPSDNAALARAIVHLIREPQHPDITEGVISQKRRSCLRHPRAQPSIRSKIAARML
jgi:hypothetical protein